MQNKNPSLFLGAGFSLGAINKSKKELPHACHLAKELYDKFLFTCLSANEKAKLFDEEKKIYNLKHVCNIIELKNLTKKRNLYLTNRFLGSHVQSKDYHYYLKEYPWHIIYSRLILEFLATLNQGTKCIILAENMIKTKKLTQSKILQNDIILKLLTHLEDSARHLSYYWIQIGIANRNLDRFEEANNAFNKAADVRGILSYNVEHAQAKNYMTWGLWNITNNGNDVNDFFTRGKETMQSLIENSPSQYFVYSVHSYTDMMLKYYKTTKTIPSISEANYMIKNLNKISEYNDDCYSSQILSNFKKFCNSHKINCSNLIYHDKKLDSDFIDIDDIGTE